MAKNVASSNADCKLAIFNLIKKIKDEADELLHYFEEEDDKESILKTIMIQQQLKIISRIYASENQKKVGAVVNEGNKPKRNMIKLLPKKSQPAKRKFED